MHVGLQVNYALILSDFHNTCIFRQIFEKFSNKKLHENSPSESRIIPGRQKEELPAFQVQVLIWTGEPGSKPGRVHGDKFIWL